MSRIRVSASTGSDQPGPSMTSSHARRSPGMPSGTSVRWRSIAGSGVLNRASTFNWGASRTGSPFGNARSGMSRPSTAPTFTRVSYATCGARPRSIRLSSAGDTPTIPVSSRSVSPAWSLASRSSSPIVFSARRARHLARSSRRSRVAMDGAWRPPLHWGSRDACFAPRAYRARFGWKATQGACFVHIHSGRRNKPAGMRPFSRKPVSYARRTRIRARGRPLERARNSAGGSGSGESCIIRR